jgi:phosphatidylserine decarboxylase
MPVGPAVQRLLPQRLLGRLIYRVARSRRSWIKRPLIQWFARTYAIDLAESDPSDPDAYATFNDFFTRALKPGARPVARDAARIASPADGTLAICGRLEAAELLQAKGRSYTLSALLGESEAEVQPLVAGHYATIYLAPHNYHRVHAPYAGRLVKTRYVPGRRYCVDRRTAEIVPELFSRNERAICWFESALGRYAVVLVGALNVASVSTVTLGEIESGAARVWHDREPREFAAGDEIGRFNLGSTVIVLFPPGAIDWDETLVPGRELLMGAPIGRVGERAARATRP